MQLYHIESINRQEQVIEERSRLLPSEVIGAVNEMRSAHPSNPIMVFEMNGTTYMKLRYCLNN